MADIRCEFCGHIAFGSGFRHKEYLHWEGKVICETCYYKKIHLVEATSETEDESMLDTENIVEDASNAAERNPIANIQSTCELGCANAKQSQNQTSDSQNTPAKAEDGEKLKIDALMATMCALIPLIAWMLYAFNVAESPRAAKLCLIISDIAVAFVLIILYFAFW